ncbi:hypothetical protein N9L47_10440 [Rhodobacteraceae bacterium]|nr:hypothetical protein [Paracoccaceae bacterium]
MTATWTAPEPFAPQMLGAAFVDMQPEPSPGLRYSLFERAAPETGLAQAIADIEAGTPPIKALANFLLDLGDQVSLITGSLPGGSDTKAQSIGPIFPPEAFDEDTTARPSQKAALLTVLEPRNDACVAMGCIDTSIAFVNARFRRKDPNGGPDKTRFEFLWIQGRAAKAPSPYASILRAGTLLLRRDIDALIAKHWSNNCLDETGVYGEFTHPPMGHTDLWSLRDGHGTTVLDLMTGAPAEIGSNAQPIYGVELPVTVVNDTSGAAFHGPLTYGMAVIALASYGLSRTSSDAPAPLVINASLGFLGGPHDGTHPTAATLNEIARLAKGPTSHQRSSDLILPAGNHLQSRTHARATPNAPHHFRWSLPPEDRTASFVEIWSSADQPPDVTELTLRPPGDTGGLTTHIPVPGERMGLTTGGKPIAQLHNLGTHLLIGIYPTSTWTPRAPQSPSGLWSLTVKGTGTTPLLFWVARDDTLAGLKSAGRQSWFRDPIHVSRDGNGDFTTHSTLSPAGSRRDGTLSVIATCPDPIEIVSGRQYLGQHPYRFAGLALDQGAPPSPKPFAPAAEISRAKGGPLSATRLGGGTTRLSGTSMASAIQARHLADGHMGLTTHPLGYRELKAYSY